MASVLKWERCALRRPASPPIQFPTTGFEVINEDVVLEEEAYPEFKAGTYYPMNIGDVLHDKYQVVGKLGFGTTSTVWLARDLHTSTRGSKVYTRGVTKQEEFDLYKHISKSNKWHRGYPYVRTALDIFTIPRSGGSHNVLVQKPMWESFTDMLYRNPTHRFTEDLLKGGLIQVFLALDYLHTDCKLIHTDIKGDNILQEIEDKSILEAFTNAEMEQPSPRKFINGVSVYASRRFERPRIFGRAVLSDFGSAASGAEPQTYDAQPDVYRSPEMMLKTEWSYPVNIWNVGCMIWDLFEEKHLFYGKDPDGKGYSTRAHLAEVIGMLGPPPLDLLKRGKRTAEFFDEDGKWKAGVEIPIDTSLEKSEENLQGKNKEMFMEFLRGMLQWRPEDRKTAKELLEDPWLNNTIDN